MKGRSSPRARGGRQGSVYKNLYSIYVFFRKSAHPGSNGQRTYEVLTDGDFARWKNMSTSNSSSSPAGSNSNSGQPVPGHSPFAGSSAQEGASAASSSSSAGVDDTNRVHMHAHALRINWPRDVLGMSVCVFLCVCSVAFPVMKLTVHVSVCISL